MKRRAFLRRMAFAALATVYLDLPLPQRESFTATKAGSFTSVSGPTQLHGLIREVFTSDVLPAVRLESPTARMFLG